MPVSAIMTRKRERDDDLASVATQKFELMERVRAVPSGRLSFCAKTVLGALLKYYPAFFQSTRSLALQCGASQTHIRRALAELTALGVIRSQVRSKRRSIRDHFVDLQWVDQHDRAAGGSVAHIVGDHPSSCRVIAVTEPPAAHTEPPAAHTEPPAAHTEPPAARHLTPYMNPHLNPSSTPCAADATTGHGVLSSPIAAAAAKEVAIIEATKPQRQRGHTARWHADRRASELRLQDAFNGNGLLGPLLERSDTAQLWESAIDLEMVEQGLGLQHVMDILGGKHA